MNKYTNDELYVNNIAKIDENNDENGNIQNGIVLFKSINYCLNEKRKFLNLFNYPCRKSQKKEILQNLTGIFQVGMNAIMGPTASGKSSLLDLLADRKDRKNFHGEIFVNGHSEKKNFKYNIGYVTQNDILCETLTVKENLMFSANLRLSNKISVKEKNYLVNQIIQQLGLDKCANTLIGTDFKRGISGGERKRTNIGMELVLSPSVLFLDEPTTGLDASMAHHIMKCLHQLSRQGRTIIFSIHQPRYSIFKLFDNIFLIGSGYCIYHGKATEILNHFSTIGLSCEEHNNPADFILDLLQIQDLQITKENNQKIEIYLNEIFLKSNIYNSIECQIMKQQNNFQNKKSEESNTIKEKSRLNDFYYLCQRTLRNSFRNPSLAMLQTIISIFLGLIIGLIYLNIDNRIDTGVKNRNGAIYFIVTNQVFLNLSALELFLKERVLFLHENRNGYYHVFTYFLSKVLCDIIPLRTIPSIVFSIIVYFMIGFQRIAQKFFIFLFSIWIISICSSSLCFLVSATVQNYGIASLTAALFFVLTLVFGGFLVEISTVINILQWIQYISVFRYGSNILLINEFVDLNFCLPNNSNICVKNGQEILTELNIEHATNWDLWKNFLALLLITIGFLLLTYIQLRRINKHI